MLYPPDIGFTMTRMQRVEHLISLRDWEHRARPAAMLASAARYKSAVLFWERGHIFPAVRCLI